MPVVLHSPLESRSPQVLACCDRAARQHVRIGMPVADARVLAPRSWFDVHDPEADREHLRRLAWQCQRFTPCAGLEPSEEPESLFLDVTGCESHFGGVEQLCRRAAASLEEQGCRVRVAAARTFGAAWALSHFSSQQRPARNAPPPPTITIIATTGAMRSRIEPLPVQSLRLPAEMVSLLYECGLRIISQLLSLPRASLPSRFGPLLLLRLDQALGEADELLEPDVPPVPVRAETRLEFPLTEPAEVLHVLQQLLHNIVEQLTERRCETQQATFSWTLEDGNAGTVEVRLLRPTLDFDRLWELLELKLETLQLAGGIIGLRLEAVACPPPPPRRSTLFDENRVNEAEFQRLIERLSSRLGEQSVLRFRQVPEAQPELSCVSEPWLTAANAKPIPITDTVPRRPLRLLTSPVRLRAVTQSPTGQLLRFRWQDQDHAVAAMWGPERIVTGWWRSVKVQRDYYRVETNSGARFWMFRCLDSSAWFFQGMFE